MSETVETYSRGALREQARLLNEALLGVSSLDVLDFAIRRGFPGSIAVVSSFGADSAVLLSLIAEVDANLPVVFLDTHKHFQETLDYVETVSLSLGLTNVQLVPPREGDLAADDPDGELHKHDTDRCCHIRKTLPMIRALGPYKCWITGRKRFQNAERESLALFEVQDKWLKINPLLNWTSAELLARAKDLDLPPHPLISKGYLSIGCAPCTSPVAKGETDPRAGRWRGQDKTECGIHFENGKVVRAAGSQG